MPRNPKEFYDTVGGRRFLFALTAMCLSAVLLYCGMLKSPDFASIMNWTVLSLVAGHTAEKFTKPGAE